MEILEKLLENGATVDFQDRVRGQVQGGREVRGRSSISRILLPIQKAASKGRPYLCVFCDTGQAPSPPELPL